MAAASDIGANFSQYSGDPSLGGGTLGAVRIDTRPIEDLARYTLLYNKSLFDQRQKDADEKIAELAKLATIHVNDLRGKDRDEIIAQLNDAITYAQDYARKSPKNPKEKIEQSLEWQKRTLDLYNNYNSGKARSVKYTAELDKIENDKTISEATKVEKRKELEQLFGGTKISEQFGGVPDYALSSIAIPPPATLKANIIQEGANANLDEALTIFNYKTNGQAAFNILNGLDALYLDEKTPKGQTPQARQQRTIESEAKLWRDTADVMNSIIKGYQTVVAGKVVFDAARFEEENADNKRLMASYNALKNMDADARAKFSQAQQGRLSDRGFGFNLPPNFTADDFREGFVDFTKPIPAEKIIIAGMFGKYAGDAVEKVVTSTDNLIQELDRRAANWRAQLAQNGENARAKLAHPSADPTKDFGNIIYGVNAPEIKFDNGTGFKRMVDSNGNPLKVVNGAVIDNNGNVQVDITGEFIIPAANVDNSIITEFNKYAGQTKLNSLGEVVSSPSTSMLKPKDGNFIVKFDNGVISGIKTTDATSTDEKPIEGTFATVDQFQYITTQTSQKGVTKYKKPEDISGGGKAPEPVKIKQVKVKGL